MMPLLRIGSLIDSKVVSIHSELKAMADQIRNFINQTLTYEERVRLIEEVVENVSQ